MLITGANGVVGSDLVKFFSKKIKVYAIYRSSNYINKKLKNRNIKWIKHDLKKKLTLNIKPKIIIHCAVTHSLSKKKDNRNLIDSNIVGFNNVIEFANKKKIKKFIHLSSLNVYGNIKTRLLKESTPFLNPDLLGSSKILMEKLLENQNFSYLNIRLPGIVGYQINDPRRPWLCKITNRLKENREVKIFNSDKFFNNIVDTYEIFKFLNFLNKKGFDNKTINMSASKPMKIKNMITFLKDKIKSNSKIIFDKKKSNYFVISIHKLKKEIGFNPSSTKKILNRYIDSFKST